MPESPEDDELYTAAEMRDWLSVEVAAVRMASVRRIREARRIVDEYAAGRLLCKEANQQVSEHETKWGEVAQDPDIAAEIHDAAVSRVYRLEARNSKRNDTRGWSR